MTQYRYIFTLIALCLVWPLQAKPELQDIEKLIQSGKQQTALTQLDELLAEDKNNPRLLFSRARALTAGGQLDLAIKQYQALIKLQPDLPEPYNNLAAIYLQQGKPEQAQATLHQAMTTHNGYARVYKNLTTLNAAQARDAYARALQMPANHQPQGLELADSLSLPPPPPPAPKATQVAVVKPDTPVTKPITQPVTKPAMVYQAPSPPADKKSEPVVIKQAVTEGNNETVQRVLQDWARAWSTKSVDQYLHFYSEDYSPPGQSHRHWVAERQDRIQRPKWIRVTVRNMQVTDVGTGRVSVTLEQEYAADNYTDVTRKEFVLQQMAGQWRIIKERGLGYIAR